MQGIKKASSFIVALSLAVSYAAVPSHAAGNNQSGKQTQTVQTQQMIVKFKNAAPKIKDFKVNESSVGGNHSLVSVDVPKGKTVNSAVKEMNARTDVAYAEPDYKLKLNSVPNDPLYSKQWYHQVIHDEQAWNVTKGSANTIVAVIDDGIDLTHPDLKNQIVSPYDMANQTDKTIPDGEHGTHVAGIIAAAADNAVGGAGVAPNVKIMPINVFSTDATGQESADTSVVINAIDYAINHGAKIISMSLGDYQTSTAFNDEIQKAYNHGVLIVAAAGNDHTSDPSYPAAYNNVISVASTNSNDSISSFSNYGSTIDLAAPGNNILSTLPGGSYGYLSGTSMAAPVVSGVAALVWSKNTTMTNTQVANDLFQSADDLGATGKDVIYGYGRVDAAKALGIKTLSQPTVHPVTDKDTVISGKVASDIVNGTVVVSNDKGEIGKTAVDSNFNFSLKIPAQPAGTPLSVKVIDNQNNQSNPTVVVVTSSTATAAPTVDPVSDRSTSVTGKTAPNVKVTVKSGSYSFRGWSNSKGQFKVHIWRPVAGTTVEVYATDHSGNKGLSTTVTVADKTAPAKPRVNPVSTSDTVVTGRAEANSQITVLSGSTVIGTATVDENNNFSVTISQQAANTKLTVISTDAAKNQSKPATVVVFDSTAADAVPTIPGFFAGDPSFSKWLQSLLAMLS